MGVAEGEYKRRYNHRLSLRNITTLLTYYWQKKEAGKPEAIVKWVITGKGIRYNL